MTRCTRWLRSLLSCACLFFTLVCDAGRFLLLCLHPRPTLAAENRFLRKQLALYQERHVKPRRATNATRLALVWLGRWCDWRQALAVVQPDTFLRSRQPDSGIRVYRKRRTLLWPGLLKPSMKTGR